MIVGEFDQRIKGARTDITMFTTAIEEHGVDEAAMLFPAFFLRYPKGAAELSGIYQRKRRREEGLFFNKDAIRVLMIGPPGCGKTRAVMQECEEKKEIPCMLNGASKWFDGGDFSDTWVLDEVTKKNVFEFSLMLKVTDKYYQTWEKKGGTFVSCPKSLYCTSNYFPREWYDSIPQQQLAAFIRRWDRVVVWYQEDGDQTFEKVEFSPRDNDRNGQLVNKDIWSEFWCVRNLYTNYYKFFSQKSKAELDALVSDVPDELVEDGSE